MLYKNQIDCTGLNETRLNETIKEQEIHINGYQIIRNDRNTDGGGLAFYVKDSLIEVKTMLK